MSKKEILICGAGPSGLASAIFLSDLGYHPRIIDRKTEISPYSKALGVNPRTLDILEKSGVTKRFLDNGRKLSGMNVWREEKHLFRNDFTKADHRFNFLFIQPQKESEEILHEELSKRGIRTEYGTELISFVEQEGMYHSKLSSGEHSSETLIAADGAHSVIRKQQQISFEGLRYSESWNLCDVEMETPVNADDAHIRVFPTGGMLMIRIRGDLWRVAGNLKDLLAHLPKGSTTGKIHWQSDFFVSHHVAEKLTHGNSVLIGDAAHIHSPIGGRGMNLGIEDAFITSQLIHQNRLSEYNSIRLKYLKRTVNRIDTISATMASKSGLRKFFKANAGLLRPFFPIAKPFMRKFAMGLDKEKF